MKIELIPLTTECKQYLNETFYEEVTINEILCYKNILYKDSNNDVIAEDTIPIAKVNKFGDIPKDYEEKQEEEVYFSYAITLPIFSSLQEMHKFIECSNIIENSTLDDIEEYFNTTDNLLILYNYIKKTFHFTISKKSEILEYQNGIFGRYLLIDENNFNKERLRELMTENCMMTNLLDRCIQIIHESNQKCNDYEERGNCISCVTNSFNGLNNDNYNCLEKLAYYTIYFGPMYVSEIYHFLRESQIIEKKFLQLDRPINIISLGCGFGPDYIALLKYCKDKWLDVEINYKGYDIEPLWGNISSAIIHNIPELKNIVEDDFDCSETDIIFMNKVFSTLKNNKLHNDFLSNFKDQLEFLPNGSLVVYNDINYFETRDKFEKFMLQNAFQCKQKYYAYKSYGENWIKLENDNNIIKLPDNLPVSPRTNSVDLVFFIYEKMKED